MSFCCLFGVVILRACVCAYVCLLCVCGRGSVCVYACMCVRTHARVCVYGCCGAVVLVGFFIGMLPTTCISLESSVFSNKDCSPCAGYADCVRCFYCGVGLKHWVASDDVWTEHVRWRPGCEYLRAVKGDHFIRETQRRLGIGVRVGKFFFFFYQGSYLIRTE